MGGYSLGDTLIGMAILIFGVIPRQLLSLAQQTSHPHSPWDSARQRLLLPPQEHSVSRFPSSRSHPSAATALYAPSTAHNSALLLLFLHPSPQQPRPHRDQGQGRRDTIYIQQRGNMRTQKRHKQQQTTHTQPQQPKPGTEAADPRMRFWGGLLCGETLNWGGGVASLLGEEILGSLRPMSCQPALPPQHRPSVQPQPLTLPTLVITLAGALGPSSGTSS